ncbi:aaap amino acid permease [Lichtheimia corymbifera JMRC:FSU:9682]|uniref:Aaap amino acid permease n=1 Tax=Lichtheimia corymbifera JMRC:FSU:9682 TaxID=1263082 RepID=A0A068RXT9_9FUNG|nr:aaap amino acid permease [Lichtheimia corymbifera JMRC:FSU:9682]
MSDSKGIGTFGSVSLLVSSMTGPGLATIPPLFQQSGWLAPTIIFIVVGVLSAFSTFFMCEVLSSIKGNEKFQAKVEFTTVAQLILGKKYHFFFQIMLFIALQAVNVASIIIAGQTFDGMIITLFKGTCGLGIAPGGWFCITEAVELGNSPFSSDDYYIFTFGFLLAAVMVIPLGFFTLVDNIIVQMTSFVVLLGVLLQWIVAFCQEGLDPSLLPAVGPNSKMVLGMAVFNFSYITTIPTWVNSLRPHVSIHKTLGISVFISAVIYIMIGIFGGMAYQMEASADITAILSRQGSIASKVTAYIFPVCALVTSIPVFCIVIRQNLIRGGLCGNPMAIFVSNLLPWLVCIPLQTKDWIGVIQNWSSLFFQSTVNYILPFILYFASRKYLASVVTPPEEKAGPPEPTDVVMYHPEENRSVSIRRSEIAYRTSRISRMEQSVLSKSPRFSGTPRSPLSPRSPRHHHGDFSPAPPIVFSDEQPPPSSLLQVPSAISPQNSPRMAGDNKQHGSPIMGITDSPNLNVPGSPITSPKMNTANVSPNNKALKTLATSPAQGLGITPSPTNNKEDEHKTSSWILSGLSLRNNSNINHNNNNLSSVIEEESKVQEDDQMDDLLEGPGFHAFKPRRWLNPFYIAVVCSVCMGGSIIFMIIYDLTLLGMGTDVFD